MLGPRRERDERRPRTFRGGRQHGPRGEATRVDFVDVRHALEPIDEMRQGNFSGTPILFRLFHMALAHDVSTGGGLILWFDERRSRRPGSATRRTPLAPARICVGRSEDAR